MVTLPGMIDLEDYTGRPRVDSVSGIMTGRRLVKNAPATRSPRLDAALIEVRDDTMNVQAVWQERSRLRPLNLRPFDKRFDNGWGCLHDMLSGLARLEGEEKAARAAKLLERLFADGVAFLALSYERELLHGETLLKRIDDEGLEPEIIDLTDAIVVPYIRSPQPELAEALGLGTSDVERADTRAMADALDKLATSIARYIRILAGETDDRDPASLAIFEKAVVRPLEQHRAYHAKQAKGAKPEPIAEEDQPEQPIPPLPSA